MFCTAKDKQMQPQGNLVLVTYTLTWHLINKNFEEATKKSNWMQPFDYPFH